MSKLLLSLDFDGVLSQYFAPWQAVDIIPDDVTPGFFEWALKAQEYFTLVIYSSRSREEKAIVAMKRWLDEQWAKSGLPGDRPQFEFALTKPPAFLTIDDRALTFTGNWDDFPVEQLLQFKPWNRRSWAVAPV